MAIKLTDLITFLALALLAYGWASEGGVSILPAKATQATYVYEKDKGGVPPNVEAALVKVNQAGEVEATMVEDDIKDESGNTPKKYKISVDAARKAGLPALVVQAGDSVVKVISSPTTEQQVMEAVQ